MTFIITSKQSLTFNHFGNIYIFATSSVRIYADLVCNLKLPFAKQPEISNEPLITDAVGPVTQSHELYHTSRYTTTLGNC